MADPGEGPGGPPAPPYFSTKMRPEGRKKKFFGARPPPPYLRVWMTDNPPPPPTRSGSATEGSAFFDVRVCYPNAESSKGLTTKQIYRQHESEKTRMHASRVLEVEQGSFTPMVFTTTGEMADECKRYHNRLAEHLSNKKGEDYRTTISRIRVNLIRPPEVCAVFNLC